MLAAITPADYPEVVDVWEASVRATHHFITEDDIQTFKPLILNQYLDMVDLFGIRDETGRLLGFLGVADHKVEMLFLHPDARGKGLGRIFMNHAINTLGATKVDVNEDNPQAVGFYQHLGFRTVGRSELDPNGNPYPILHLELV
ncbi:GNAT family N-acetyltransferase [Larkinella sp. VNQ87]|uniref:GNAT family N-acetyltransferase n=1 Tax=Larkinella sp. VNQ87 TaxID=3400921 RepID=UPI003C0BA269